MTVCCGEPRVLTVSARRLSHRAASLLLLTDVVRGQKRVISTVSGGGAATVGDAFAVALPERVDRKALA
jgi:hypothetical protein